MSSNEERDELRQYIRNFDSYPVIDDPEEVARLVEQWRTDGDQKAYKQLVYGNVKLVISIALQYTGRGIGLLDLIQEGIIGLMRALKTFDPKKGKISTWAHWWIHQAIGSHVMDKSRTVRIPAYKQDKMQFIYRTINSFYAQHGRQPTNQEVFERIRAMDGTKNEKVVGKKMTLRDVVVCRALLAVGDNSLDAPIKNTDGTDDLTYHEVVADSRVNIETDVEVKNLQKAALERVKYRTKNDPRTLAILRLRFEDDMTLNEVGLQFGLSRERIRQIEATFVKKIAKDLKITKKGAKNILAELPLREV